MHFQFWQRNNLTDFNKIYNYFWHFQTMDKLQQKPLKKLLIKKESTELPKV